MVSETAAMRRALRLAASPGFVKGPNPRVGCVLIDNTGAPVGEGWHAGAGHPHAEVAAIADAGARARGSTAVVTLEPCSHTGRTGPCVDALIAAGVRRVVWASTDPNPIAAGGGERLRLAGIDTAAGLLAADADQLNRSWIFAHRSGRPYVTWKFAGSLDGRSAAADGSSRWISSAAARADAHRLRARAGAVLAGIGSVLVDNAQLAARGDAGEPIRYADQPLRVVIGHRQPPVGARIRDDAAPTLRIPTHDPAEVLAALSARGVHDVLLEGGPTVAAAFWRAGLVDEVVAYLAPVLLGSGPSSVADLGVATMAGAQRLDVVAIDVIGQDADANVRITARPVISPVPSNN